jgi:hypothetical protein
MELKSGKIKSMNDFVASLLVTGLGIFVLVSDNIIQGKVINPPNGGIFVRADVYLRLLGGIIAFLGLLILLKSLNFSKSGETRGFHLIVSLAGILTIAALIVYVLVLTSVGFFIATFSLSVFLVCLYMHEEQGGVKPSRKELLKKLAAATIFSGILVVVVYLLFSKVLYVSLP